MRGRGKGRTGEEKEGRKVKGGRKEGYRILQKVLGVWIVLRVEGCIHQEHDRRIVAHRRDVVKR